MRPAWIVIVASIACAPARFAEPVAAGEPQVTPPAITEISLERRCFGCDRELKISFRRDGLATRTVFGNARSGTVDRHSSATIPAAGFGDLALRVVSERFWDLAAEYQDPRVADGNWAVTTISAGNLRKAVTDRNERAPQNLRRLQARIEEMASGLAWKSGEPR